MKRILIAEDEPFVVRVLKLKLENAGYQVRAEANGEAALARLRESPPDVLITDIQMPRMTGRELCERIQAEMPERKFLIFILTSRTEVEHREWSSRIDNVMFLEKPVSMKDLLARLDDYFAAAPAAAGA
jgi:CheY-like chemotaxis protein